MSEFISEPVLVLEGIDGVRSVLNQNRNELCGFKGLDIFRVKSPWLISLIDEILADGRKGFAYNADIKKLAEQRLGFPEKPDSHYCTEGDPLSLLVYNAQSYRRSDALTASGYVPFTNSVLETAHKENRKIETRSGHLLSVREIGGKLYAMLPRARNNAIAVMGQPVKLVAA